MENSRSAKLDAIFGTPLFAVLLAIGCNVLWGSAFPFIKMGYRLFAIETSDTASILCFAGVRFMLGSLLVLAGSLLFAAMQARQRYEGTSITLRRLRRIQFFALACFVCAGVFMVEDCYHLLKPWLPSPSRAMQTTSISSTTTGWWRC